MALANSLKLVETEPLRTAGVKELNGRDLVLVLLDVRLPMRSRAHGPLEGGLAVPGLDHSSLLTVSIVCSVERWNWITQLRSSGLVVRILTA